MLSARPSSNACSAGKRRDPLIRTRTLFPPPPAPARRVAAAARAIVVAVACLACAAVVFAASQQAEPANQPAPVAAGEPPAHAAAPAGQAEESGQNPVHGEAEGEGENAESPWASVARLFNFAILAGGLFYLLRSPLMGFLEQRGVTVRSELTTAAALKREAAAQVEQIEAKMQALPGEIEALKRRGAEEIAAEEARIHALAESERRRLLDHAKREIDMQLRIAERDLKKRAGELAVSVATERVKRTITDTDHVRLVERYVAQVRH